MKGRITLNTREQTRARVRTMVIEGRCTAREAAWLVQLSERQVLRLKKGLREQGPAALAHGNRGCLSMTDRRWKTARTEPRSACITPPVILSRSEESSPPKR